jgi:TetR/AcrR family transcriptional regulator, cholesterol catabolism regulator
MASAGISRAEKSARRLSEITDAAAKVFARRGYHGASTQDIADVLGMRQASLYYYFESKEAALEAVCVSGLEDYAKRALAISKSGVASSEKVAALVFQHLAPLAERLDYTVVFLRERRFLPEPARKRIRAIEVRYERLIERIIEQGVADGEFRRDLDTRMAALALLGLGNSAALWFAREPGTTVERVARSYIDLLVRGFRVRH